MSVTDQPILLTEEERKYIEERRAYKQHLKDEEKEDLETLINGITKEDEYEFQEENQEISDIVEEVIEEIIENEEKNEIEDFIEKKLSELDKKIKHLELKGFNMKDVDIIAIKEANIKVRESNLENRESDMAVRESNLDLKEEVGELKPKINIMYFGNMVLGAIIIYYAVPFLKPLFELIPKG